MNPEQQRAFDFVGQGHNAFVTGKAGTGKTYLLSRIFDEAVEQGKNVAVTCTTGNILQALPVRASHPVLKQLPCTRSLG